MNRFALGIFVLGCAVSTTGAAAAWQPLCSPDSANCPGHTAMGSTVAASGNRIFSLQQRMASSATVSGQATAAVFEVSAARFETKAAIVDEQQAYCSSTWPAFACVGVGAALFTNDGGASFRKSTRSFISGISASSAHISGPILALLPFTYVVGISDTRGSFRLHLTSDDGLNWQLFSYGDISGAPRGLASGRAPGEGLLAGTDKLTGAGRLFLVNQQGIAATPYSSDATLAQHDPSVLFKDSNVVDRYWLGTKNGSVLRSQDAGVTWQLAGRPTTSEIVSLVTPAPSTVVVSTADRVLVSRDGGATWQTQSAGLVNLHYALATAGGQVVASGPDGMFVCPQLDCAGDPLPVPLPKIAGEGPFARVVPFTVVEFFNTHLGHYFMTSNDAEVAAIDAGAAGQGWGRTGFSFSAWAPFFDPRGKKVWRFYGSTDPGPNSHFFTTSYTEAQSLIDQQRSTPATQPRWNFEGIQMATALPGSGGLCDGDLAPVYRAYNNGFARGIDSNHRYSTDLAVIQQMTAQGWLDEGVVMCIPR